MRKNIYQMQKYISLVDIFIISLLNYFFYYRRYMYSLFYINETNFSDSIIEHNCNGRFKIY